MSLYNNINQAAVAEHPLALKETISGNHTDKDDTTLPPIDDADDTGGHDHRHRLHIEAEIDDEDLLDYHYLQPKRLNLLDHGGLITKKQGACGFGSGLVSFIQSLLMSTLFGYLLAASGLYLGAKTFLKSFMGEIQPMLDPLSENLDKFFEEAEKRGIGREELVDRLKSKAITHKLITRVQRYAVISLFGRGGGSVGLTMLSGIIALTSLNNLPGMITSATNMLFIGKQALDIVRDEIITYRFVHHPEIIKSRAEMLVDYHTSHTKEAEKRLMHSAAREVVENREHLGENAVDGFMVLIMDMLEGRHEDKQKVNVLFSTLADILETPPPIKPEPTQTVDDMMKRFAKNVFQNSVKRAL